MMPCSVFDLGIDNGVNMPTEEPIRIVVYGAGGRSGSLVCEEIMRRKRTGEVKLVSAVSHPGGQSVGRVCAPLPDAPIITAEFSGECDAVIDFSTPDGTLAALSCAEKNGAALLIATTGLPDSTLSRIEGASKFIPIIIAPNTSACVTVLLDTVRRITKSLGSDTRVEIVETHHKKKKDAPSGTALAIGRVVEEAGGSVKPGQYHSLRGGGVIGEHSVRFYCDDDYLEVRHVATSRRLFAAGALRGVLWLTRRKNQPGLYSMMDVIEGTARS